jgi:hypothetical protein
MHRHTPRQKTVTCPETSTEHFDGVQGLGGSFRALTMQSHVGAAAHFAGKGSHASESGGVPPSGNSTPGAVSVHISPALHVALPHANAEPPSHEAQTHRPATQLGVPQRQCIGGAGPHRESPELDPPEDDPPEDDEPPDEPPRSGLEEPPHETSRTETRRTTP